MGAARMKMQQRLPGLIALGMFLFSITAVMAQTPAGTAFTYQGLLTQNGTPADGAYDLTCSLWGAATGGTKLGSAVILNDVAVVKGRFTADLDFGQGVFNGDARWLEIGVRPGASTGSYTTLTPRQNLRPAPYAITALNVYSKADADARFVHQSGLDTIATSSSQPALRIKQTGSGWALACDGGVSVTQQISVGTTVTAAGFRYSAPLVRHLTLPAAGFRAPSGAGWTFGDGLYANTAMAGVVYAPVNLPDGAIITGFHLVCYQSTGTAGFRAILAFDDQKQWLSGVISDITSNAGMTGYLNFSGPILTIGGRNKIDNLANSYYVSVQSTGWASNTRLKAVVIDYTIDQPE